MPKNKVQFQKGMSLKDFLARYGTQAQCEQALTAWRWPQGFVCPECGKTAHCVLGRGLYQCHHCRRQTSITAGTLFAGTKLPLSTWFLAIYLLTQSKNGISALEMSRQLGVCYNSAWLLKHKLMQAMLEREQGRALEGVIQMDDAYWGGRRKGGKRGRGARGKTPFVVAVATDAETGKPLTVRMDRVKGFRSKEIGRWSRKHLQAGAHVRSDGLSCFAAVQQANCTHEALPTSGPEGAENRKAFVWVDTVLGNVKSAMNGTYRAIRAKHLPRYLAEFAYRFNRRFDLASMLTRLGRAAANTPPMPYRFVKLAEAHW
jgi:ribosomal protein L37AE/L43A/transposase-like protein